ncbi:hybrid non-ribosomal peptide synthetase/type I polyketide synthase [Paenibacillus sp. UNC217MF]|uniref:hybrid non-ribosomal peptide synthetase/type I polyketide synthase n=1 Tax=Paenibacillus sp. UNC217MF TaxID=1449062 RepID=UPI00068D86E0|nr:hybrid non-ribosomal peptide synthetase/type I polyketide synthase [Paenibacillus sp. UNC217MF]
MNESESALIQAVRDVRENHVHGVTLITGDRQERFYSYKQVFDNALMYLHTLQAHGIRAGDELVFQLNDDESEHFIFLFWACILGGIIAVPVSVGSNAEHKNKFFKIWGTLQNPYLATSPPIMERLRAHASDNRQTLHDMDMIADKTVYLEALECSLPAHGTIHQGSSRTIAFIQFSSGSTGNPKGVIVTHENVYSNTRAINNRFETRDVDSFLSWMPLTHDMGLISFHITPLIKGVNQYIMPTSVFIRRPTLWFKKINDHNITITSSPNFGYKYFLKMFKPEIAADWDLSRLRIIVNGAEPISSELCNEFLDKMAPYGLQRTSIRPAYGLAEATVAVSLTDGKTEFVPIHLDRSLLNIGQEIVISDRSTEHTLTFVEVGHAIDDCAIRICDDHDRILPDKVIGHIQIQGKNVTAGYYNNRETTADMFTADQWVRTGDLGFFIDGSLVMTGRFKDMIIVNGQNIYPHDIERTAEEVEGVELGKIAACGVYNKERGEDDIVVFVVSKKNDAHFASLSESLEDHLFQRGGWKIAKVIPIRQMPKTTSGKVQRYKLAQNYAASQAKESDNISPAPVSTERKSSSLEMIMSYLHHHCNAKTNLNEHESFVRFGLDSLEAVRMIDHVADRLGMALSPALIWDYPTPNKLAHYLDSIASQPSVQEPDADRGSIDDSIAIVGMEGKFPGADGIAAYWELLKGGKNAISDIDDKRKALCGINPDFHMFGGFLEGIDQFDSEFFAISPREAASMDPQQRLLLEVTWRAFENANINPAHLKGGGTGVFIGASATDYIYLPKPSKTNESEPYQVSGGALSIIANRISYFYDFRGPSMCIDSACSSSLVALHYACQSLLNGECDAAVAGGVNLLLSASITEGLQEAKMLSEDGTCKTFDDRANGYVRGEGCGVVILKRLKDAIADGDRIHAVIKGTAVNQDGRSNGLTAPNGIAQRQVIRRAIEQAQLKPADIGYVEAHGTGTPLGDPIEAEAIKEIYGCPSAGIKDDDICYLGSVKTNIGHLEAAAGIAGLIKTVLAIQHGEIPAHLHMTKLNRYISLDRSRLRIPVETESWIKPVKAAGVSSFGFGGTNAHVIVQEAPSRADKRANNAMGSRAHLLTLSSPTTDGLVRLASTYDSYLQHASSEQLGAICGTANTRRTAFLHRASFVGDSLEEIHEKVQSFSARGVNGIAGSLVHSPKIVFMFTGQGSQYVNMARGLYASSEVFRTNMNRCADLVKDRLDHSILDVIYDIENNSASALLHRTDYTQCALFAIEYSLAQVWLSLGIEPAAVVGHSVGEYVAACIAGVFSLDDALAVVAERGKLMTQKCDPGAMAAIMGDMDELVSVLHAHSNVEISAINSSNNFVIAGAPDDVAEATNHLQRAGVHSVTLEVNYGFHSQLVEPMLQDYYDIIKRLKFNPPQIPLVSNVTGDFIGSITAEYWIRHTREAVRFKDSLYTLVNDGCNIFLEIGAHAVLSRIGQREFNNGAYKWIPSLLKGRDDEYSLLEAVGNLYVAGGQVQFEALYQLDTHECAQLPNYPFAYTKCWQGGHMNPESPKEEKLVKTTQDSNIRTSIMMEIKGIFAQLLNQDVARIDENLPLLEMGADSLILMDVIQKVKNKYGVTFSARDFFTEITSISKLCAAIESVMPHEEPPALTEELPIPTAVDSPSPALFNSTVVNQPSLALSNSMRSESGLLGFMSEQLASMERVIQHQLSFIHNQPLNGTAVHPNTTAINHSQNGSTVLHPSTMAIRPESPAAPSLPTISEKTWVPYQRWQDQKEESVTGMQEQYARAVVARLADKTKKSKEWIAKHRPVFADYRGASGFRFSTKEVHYLPVVDHAKGSRFWDKDGNEYIDLTMGFGVNFFGHAPEFIDEAIKAELQNGYALGPQSGVAGEVADLIHQITGMDRSTFCNSGTEAVMAALRLARAVTGKNKIAMFAGSYHGTYDGVLASMFNRPGSNGASPMAPGIPAGITEDVMILEYNNPQSLEIIRSMSGELAAVLVEPVQSRRPDLVPIAFLEDLREITRSNNTALIFDEVITGFRVHPAGFQGISGIRPDMCVYGKVLGGGMHIGVVAGSAKFLDAVDGGQWNFGDRSYPQAETTIIAGTFCKHPITMACTHAVLLHLLEFGPELQENVNAKTAYLVRELNDFFESANIPMKMVHFGSLFRFVYQVNMDLFFYGLLEKGVYIWEGRNCFLSTAHSDEDIRKLIGIIKDTMTELIDAQMFPGARIAAGQQTSDKELIPVSEDQRELWVLSQLGDQAAIACNETVVLSLKGTLRHSLLTEAMNSVVARHDSLRVTFDHQGNMIPIRGTVRIDMPMLDLSSATDSSPESAAIEWIRDETERPLASGSLYRCTLLKLTTDRHYLVFTASHVLVDGYSIGIILEEMFAAYSLLLKGMPIHFPEPLQLRSYMDWKAELESNEERQANNLYWLNKTGSNTTLDLPLDMRRPHKKTYNGDIVRQMVNPMLAERVNRFSQRNKVTPFVTFLSAYALLLNRLTHQTELTVGVPFAQRSLPGGSSYVGYAITLLPITIEMDEHAEFTRLLSQVKTSVLEAQEHGEFSFSSVFRNPDASHRLSPLEVVFNYERRVNIPDAGNIEVDTIPTPITATKYELSFNVMEFNRNILLDLTYNSNLFRKDTIERFLTYYENILQAIIEPSAEKSPIALLPLLNDAERERLLFAGEPANLLCDHRCLHEVFEEQARHRPDAVAAVYDEQQLTYGELNERANRLARHLRMMGAGSGVLVAILVERSLDMLVGILGVLKAGAAYVPIDPAYPAERIRYVMDDAAPAILLTQSHLLRSLPQHELATVCLDEERDTIEKLYGEDLNVELTSTNLAYVIYTSGSTGKPKGVMISHENVVRLFTSTESIFGFHEDDVWALFHSYSFDFSVWEMWGAWFYGGRLVVVPHLTSRSPENLYHLLEQHKVTVLNQTPSAFRPLAQYEESQDSSKLSLRYINFGGETLDFQSLKPWIDRHGDRSPQFINMYGITETTVVSTYRRITTEDIGQDTGSLIGIPFPDTKVYVLNRHIQPVPPGVTGEMYVGGPGVAKGYLNRAELNSERFVLDPFANDPEARLYKSGDLARIRHNGELEYVGRADHQVKIRGYRIELGEIEAALKEHPSVREALVIADVDPHGDKRLIAYVETDQSGDIMPVLRAHLESRLPDYMIPSLFMWLQSMPLTNNGKIDRDSLPKPGYERTDLQPTYVAPRNPAEMKMAAIWADVLGVKEVGVEDNFFELGGHSLLATRLLSRIREAFQAELPLHALFDAPTVAALTAKLEDMGMTEMESETEMDPVLLSELLTELEKLPEEEREAVMRELPHKEDAWV